MAQTPDHLQGTQYKGMRRIWTSVYSKYNIVYREKTTLCSQDCSVARVFGSSEPYIEKKNRLK
jgi:hypothetical protein